MAHSKISSLHHIYGDDAVGFRSAPASNFSGYRHTENKANIRIPNNRFVRSVHRALNINASNAQITNNTIETISDAPPFPGAHATLIFVFSTRPEDPINNVNVEGNTIKILGDWGAGPFAISNAKNCTIESNTMEASHILMQRSIPFGSFYSDGGPNPGALHSDVVLQGNTTTNIFFVLNRFYVPVNGGFVFRDNTLNFNVDRGVGGWWAVFRIPFPFEGETPEHTFKDTTININQSVSTGNYFAGVIFSASRKLKNMTFDNVDVNFSGNNTPPYAFAVAGDDTNSVSFDSSNLIRDCDLSGVPGSNAIKVTGSDKSVRIENSFGDGNTPLSVER